MAMDGLSHQDAKLAVFSFATLIQEKNFIVTRCKVMGFLDMSHGGFHPVMGVHPVIIHVCLEFSTIKIYPLVN